MRLSLLLLLLTGVCFAQSPYPQTVVTPYGNLSHHIHPNLSVNFGAGNRAGAYYQYSPNRWVGPGGTYQQLPSGNIIGPTGITTRHASGYLTPNGRFYSDNSPYPVLGSSSSYSGREYLGANMFRYRDAEMATQVARDRARSQESVKRYIQSLPRQYQGRQAMGLP